MDNELDHVVDQLPGLVWSALPGGRIEFLNRRWREYIGLQLHEPPAVNWQAAIHPDDFAQWSARWATMLTAQEPWELELRLRRSDGVYRWFLCRASPETGDSKRVARWFGLLTDVDDRRRVENDLRTIETNFSGLVGSFPGLMVTMNTAGSVELFSRDVLHYFGKTPEELRDWAITDAVHPDDLPRVVSAFTESITTGAPYSIEHRCRRADGVYRWFHVRALAVRDAYDQISGWYVVLVDIDGVKRAESAIRASEQDLTLIINTMPALAWSANSDGTAEFFNEHYLHYVGLTTDEAKGWGWARAVHTDDMPALARAWQHALTSGQPAEAEARLRRHDGEYRWFLFRTGPLRDQSGAIVQWYGVNTDIEELKRAEQALRRSENFLLQIQSVSHTGGWRYDLATDIVESSPEIQRFYDVQPGEDITRPPFWFDRIHPEDRPRVQSLFERCLREKLDYQAGYRILLPNGSVRYQYATGHPILDDAGKLVEFIGASMDMTEHWQATTELQRSYWHLTEAQRLSQTGSFTMDLTSDEHIWSDEFYRICEFEPGSKITTERLGAIVLPEDSQLYEDARARALADGHMEFEYRIQTSMGVKYLRGVAHRIEEIPNRMVLVGAVQDVTASKLADQALSKARAELAHVTRVNTVNALTASITHELNQPLSGIITNASTGIRMLNATPPNIDGARETVKRTLRDGNRAADVISRLRALFSKKALTVEALDLTEAAREVIALSLSELQTGGIFVQLQLADDLPPITGDRVQLQQVILNLVRNASDAMAGIHDRARQLRVKTERDDDRVQLSVRDTGIGLDRDATSQLFDPFYTTKTDGMGIGLSVSRSIIESHGGRIWATSNDGPGATFAFSIPCEAMSRADEVRETDRRTAAHGGDAPTSTIS